ncbi:MAG: histidine--tRNA ligase [Spirochaetes bacterium]|nr:histidine--tRNA ligase [Spirochaetota bacterium]
MIEPRTLKGFRDTPPETMIIKKEIIKNFEIIFEKYGFLPIDTPALEYSEILLGKGGGETDKQIYRFNDHGGRDIAMRFDLTVPLARFVSQHFNELTFPFKRYHIAPVWRGENTQKGRYREFYQCDFDILGTKSLESDIEILSIIKDGILSLNIGNFTIYVNNRKILNSLLTKFDLSEKSAQILRTIDKIYKIGADNVYKELVDVIGISKKNTEDILKFLNITGSADKDTAVENTDIFDILDSYKSILGKENSDPVIDTEYIFKILKKLEILKYFSFNPAITRGLDYYTGIVFEVYVKDRMDFGSICSGGRYDNLTGLYSKNEIPGIGAAFGLDRILSLMEEQKIIKIQNSKTRLLIFNLDDDLNDEYHILASKFRENGINTEIIYEKQKISSQFKLAEKKNIPFVLFAGNEEIKNKKYNIKNILKGEETKLITFEDILKILK